MKAPLFVSFVLTIARAAQPVTTLANFANSVVYAVQTDAAGNLYVAGLQGNFAAANPFVAKLSPAGQTIYSTTLAGSDFGIAWAIVVDSSGAAYVFGNTDSPDFPVTAGALQTSMQGQFRGRNQGSPRPPSRAHRRRPRQSLRGRFEQSHNIELDATFGIRYNEIRV